MDFNAILAAGILIAAVFVFTALPVLRRARLSSGKLYAEATVLEKNVSRRTVKPDDSFSTIQPQELTLKLEVRPSNGVPYTTQTTFPINGTNSSKLEPGAIIQVDIDRRDPNNVRILP